MKLAVYGRFDALAPAGVALAGAAGMLFCGAFDGTAGLLAVALLGLGLWLSRRAAANRLAQRRAIEAYLDGQHQLGQGLLPIWAAHIEASRRHTEDAATLLAHRFAAIADHLNRAARPAELQAEGAAALTQLQFQDRVDQNLVHVRRSMERLAEQMAAMRAHYGQQGELRPVDAQALLAELERSYASADERALHHSMRGELASPPRSSRPVDEITFF